MLISVRRIFFAYFSKKNDYFLKIVRILTFSSIDYGVTIR